MNSAEKSPHWDEISSKAKKLTVSQSLEGFPFNEDLPKNKEGFFEIILRDGSCLLAHLDLSTQYRAEGIQWIDNRDGTTWPRSLVAAWKSV